MRLLTLVLLTLLLGACARDYVVLLPESDGKVGAIAVKQDGKETVLDSAYSSARTRGNRITVGKTDVGGVNQMFDRALSSLPPPAISFVIFFLSDSDEYTEESKAEVTRLLGEMKQRPAAEITVIGHTDRVGADTYNDTLSLQRAQKVADMLVQLGITKDRIIVAGRGERELLVPTADEVAEPRNRRVEVNVR